MARISSIAAALLVRAACGSLQLTLNSDASYIINFDGDRSWSSALSGGATAVRNNGKLFSSADGSLRLSGAPVQTNGVDQFGTFTAYNVSWNTGGSDVFQTNFYVYQSMSVAPYASAIVFEQVFPQGLTGCANGNVGDVVSYFPVLGPQQSSLNTDLRYLTFNGLSGGSTTGTWSNSGINGGAFGGYGGNAMVAIMNGTLATVVLSSVTDHLTAYPSLAGSVGGALTIGFNGNMEAVPSGYVSRSILVAGAGVATTLHAWGDALLLVGGKKRTTLTQDFSTSYLSWWNDNGAYYSYHTENGKTYEATIRDELAYAQGAGLPVRAVQFDSWWYYKRGGGCCNDGALLLWEPMPTVFPDLMTAWPGMPLILHNRYFADVNNYTQMGVFDFLTEPGSPLSLPLDKAFWRYILGKAKAWGAIVYEQDWLYRVFQQMKGPWSNISIAHTWLHSMGDVVSEMNMTLQYCLPEPRHIVASTAIPAVTHARASPDYHPNSTPNYFIQISSLLYSAVGIQPFKDVFWSTVEQPGNPYGPQNNEPNTDMQVILSALSTGPVGPGDGVGNANASLIMTCCRANDGLILKPDRPAYVLDSVFAYAFANNGALPIVAHTHTTLGNTSSPMRWHFIYAMNLSAPFPVSFTDVGPSFTVTSYVVVDYFNLLAGPVATVSSPTGSFAIPTGQGVPSPAAGAMDLQYHVWAPVMPASGWVLLGEVGKVTTMSTLRVLDLEDSAAGFTATVSAAGTETITFAVIPPVTAAAQMATNGAGVSTVSCSMGAGPSTATLSCTQGECTCM